MRIRILFISMLVLGCMTACVSPRSDSLYDVRRQAAIELRTECRKYYSMREPRIIDPHPSEICALVYRLAMQGKPIGNWRR